MIPEGWKLVPVEPTREMVLGGEAEIDRHDFMRLDHAYRAMLAAAPTPPVQQGKPDMWLRQTSSKQNPPHGWAVHFTPQDGGIPVFLKAQAPTPPVQQDGEALEVLWLVLDALVWEVGSEPALCAGQTRRAIERARAFIAQRGEK